MSDVSTILKDDSAKLVSGGANRFVNVSLSNSASSTWRWSILTMEVEEEAPAVSGGGRIAAKIVVDTTLGGLKYSSNIDPSAQKNMKKLEIWFTVSEQFIWSLIVSGMDKGSVLSIASGATAGILMVWSLFPEGIIVAEVVLAMGHIDLSILNILPVGFQLCPIVAKTIPVGFY
ncbi:hypothetical protein Tco_0146577 [Tanacetum coccineum]